MEDSNLYMHRDDSASESEKPVRKSLSQTSSAAQLQANNEAGLAGEAKMAKTSKKRRKSGNVRKKGDSYRSLSNDIPEHSLSTESSDSYRELTRKCRALKKQRTSLKNELTQIQRDTEKLEAENRAISAKLVALEGSVEDGHTHDSTSNI